MEDSNSRFGAAIRRGASAMKVTCAENAFWTARLSRFTE